MADEPNENADTDTEDKQSDSAPDLGDAGKAALAAERKARKEAEKAHATLAARLKELEDRDKSEAEKLSEKASADAKRAEAAELRAARLEVALAKGLTQSQAKRLVGDTREALEADADELLADLGKAAKSDDKRAPRPDPSQGSKGKQGVSGRDAGLAEARKRFPEIAPK